MVITKCAVAILINCTNISWNEQDKKVYDRGKQVCQDKYKGCMIKIVKCPNQHYNIQCRRERESEKDNRLLPQKTNTQSCADLCADRN